MDWPHRNECLADVLGPIDCQHFFSTYWEQQVLHIEREDPERYSTLLRIADIESALSTQRFELSDAQLAGQVANPDDYLDANGQVVASRLLDGYRNGSTLVLSQANRRLPTLADFCRRMQAGFAMRCQTNVYLSPAGQQGFRPHYDSHDVFILQVQGKKTFQFYAGGPDLPANHHRFDPERHQPGDAEGSIALNAGDTLYIPRGVMHDAIAHPDDASLHITLGLFPLTTMDVLQALLQHAEPELRALRQSVAGAHDMHRDSDLHQQLQQALTETLTEERIAHALVQLRDDIATSVASDCTANLGSGELEHTPPSGTVRADLARWHDVEDTDQSVTVRTAGLSLHGNGAKADALRRLASGSAVPIGQSAGCLDSELAEILLRQHLIFTVD